MRESEGSKFYVVSDPASKKCFRGHFIGEADKFHFILSNPTKFDNLEVNHLAGGREPGELFWNRVCDPFCLRNDIVESLKNQRVSGWKAIPTTVKDKNGKIWDNYSTIIVNGRIDAVNFLDSDVIFHKMAGGQIPHFRGIKLNTDTWDNSDILMERPNHKGDSSAFIYATDKFVSAITISKVKNIRFTKIEDFEMECFTSEDDQEYTQQLRDKIAKASA